MRAHDVEVGKSTFAREVVRRAAVGAAAGEQRVVCCAATGIAATNLPNGNTLHCTFAVKLTGSLTATGPSVELAKARLTNARLVIVDEMSMLDAVRIVQVDTRLRAWKDAALVRMRSLCMLVCLCVHAYMMQAFGGVGMVLMGDFFQMPPVGGRTLIDAGLKTSSPAASALFESFIVVQLTQQMRASGDLRWQGVLNAFTDPVMSMTPVRQSNILGIVREFSAADVAANEAWRDAIVVTYDNATRHAINAAQVRRFARRNGVPVITWNQRLDDTSASAFAAAAQRHACSVDDVRAPYAAERKFHFAQGAPAFLTANINV